MAPAAFSRRSMRLNNSAAQGCVELFIIANRRIKCVDREMVSLLCVIVRYLRCLRFCGVLVWRGFLPMSSTYHIHR